MLNVCADQVGGTQSYEHRGVIPRATNWLFGMINGRSDMSYTVCAAIS